ncbi:phage tail tape measure protein [Candidatus Symbiopectobacterium sp. NZEC135]|uniref:phage tail tape measure protein n=1 Tax=Candidatus Symbiopectobacterium sp. NZEC135 TaxID=2820471 RepID=UPI002227345C|nr:phage tail tape measure protein [Candidatus Symbiopectobacterium sp. NZEC135]MCW2479741.1 phage tail tape measure protein [Candidatus Symbiopectobacterium sp. NZEC135]
MATLRELIIKISANSQSFQSEISRASRMGSDYYKTMQNGGRQAAAASRESRRALAEVNAQLASVKSTAIGMTGALAGAFATGNLINLADQWNMVNARLKQASTSTQDFTSNQAALMALSQRTGTAFGDNAGLFARSAASLREYGYSSQDALKVTEALATGLKLSGAGVQESSSVITQFSQALAQGVLRGEEFNSVNENGDRVIRALASGMGVARKDLKAMADDGKLTADKVVPALISQLGAMQKEFEAMPATVGGSVTKVENAFQQWVGGVNQTSGVTATLSGTLDKLAGNIDDVATAMGVLVAVGAARYFGNMASGAFSATAKIIDLRKEQISAAAAQLNAAQMVQRKAVADAEAAVSAYNLAVAEANVAKGSNASMIATQSLTTKRSAMIAANAALINSNRAVAASEASVNGLTSASSVAMSGLKSLGGLLGGIPGIVMLGATAWYAVYQQQEQARLSALQYADIIDQVRDSLKSMSLTQVNANLGRSSLSLDIQDNDISAQENKISELSNQLYNARQAAKNASEGTWLYNDATKNAAMYASQLADEEGKLEQMQNKRKQTQSLIDDLTQQSISKTVEMSGAVNSLADMYERLNKVTRQTTMFSHPQYAGPVLPKLDDKQQSAITKQQRERILSGLKDIERARKQAGFEADDLNLSGGWRQKYISDAEVKFRNDEANKPKKKGPKTDEEKAVDTYDRLIKQQREQLALGSSNTELAKIRYQTSQGELSTLSSIQKQELLRNAALIDQAEIRKKATEYENGLIDSNANAKAANDANLIGFGEGSRVRERMQEMISIRREFIQKDDELRRQHQAGEIDDEFFNRAIALNKRYLDKRLSDQQMYYSSLDDQRNNWMGGMSDGFADWADEATNYATQASQGMKTAMSGAVGSITEMLNGNKNSWKDWGVSVLKIIQNVLVNMAVANAAQSASGVFGSLFSAGVSAFSGAASASSNAFTTGAYNNLSFNAQGGVYQSPSLSAYSGGVYSTPQLFAFAKGAGVFAEAGPEAIMPLTRAANGSLGVRAIMPDTSTVNNGGNVYVTITENGTTSVAGNGNQDFAREFTQIIQREYKKLRDRDLSQGGAINRAISGGR